MALDIESEAASYWGTSLEKVFFARREEQFTPPPPPSDEQIYSTVGVSIRFRFTILGREFQGYPAIGIAAWRVYKATDPDYDWQIGFHPNGRGWSDKPESSRQLLFPDATARTILVCINNTQNH